MTNYALGDPDKSRDPLPYSTILDMLSDEWSDEDTTFVIYSLSKYLSGPQDKYADAELVRVIRRRGESIIERLEEAAAVDPRDGWQE